MIGIYIALPKRRKRGLEDCWKIKKFQSRRICINASAGRKRECKISLFYFKKNIKILILGIDNIGRLVYCIHINKKIRRNPNDKNLQNRKRNRK